MPVAHCALGCFDQMRRRVKAERDGVADVEIAHPDSASLNGLRLGDDVANGVGEPVDSGSDRNRLSGPRDRHSFPILRFYIGLAAPGCNIYTRYPRYRTAVEQTVANLWGFARFRVASRLIKSRA